MLASHGHGALLLQRSIEQQIVLERSCGAVSAIKATAAAKGISARPVPAKPSDHQA